MLTRQLASEIVKRTMSILHVNVNVMDKTGTILASGYPNRIGQMHDGAKKVIEEDLIVEINSLEADQWGGARPGINLPIRFHDDVVGVIGITGEPEEIRSYSELVKMGAELTLEQAFLTREIERNDRLRDDVISHLLLGSDKEQEYIKERARSLKIDTDETVAVVLISVPYYHTADVQSVKLTENWVKSWLSSGDEMVHLYTNQFIILKKQQIPNLDTNEKLKVSMEKKRATAPVPRLTIGLGPFVSGFEAWRHSFKTAQIVKDTAETLYPDGGVWDQASLGISIMCYRFLNEVPTESKRISDIYRRLFEESDGQVLHETFMAYVNENGEMSKTADRLFIHRNTLAYRLEKIRDVTGKNPKNLQDVIELKIGQVLYLLSI